MKKIILPLVFFVIAVLSLSACYSQKLVQKVSDAKSLEINAEMFANRPLSDLLYEIKPKIKLTFGEGERADGAPSYFIFNFVSRSEKRDLEQSKLKVPARIIVYVKEKFQWNGKNKSSQNKENWTSKDFDRYKNLTVIAIRVLE